MNRRESLKQIAIASGAISGMSFHLRDVVAKPPKVEPLNPFLTHYLDVGINRNIVVWDETSTKLSQRLFSLMKTIMRRNGRYAWEEYPYDSTTTLRPTITDWYVFGEDCTIHNMLDDKRIVPNCVYNAKLVHVAGLEYRRYLEYYVSKDATFPIKIQEKHLKHRGLVLGLALNSNESNYNLTESSRVLLGAF
mgnify:CR=1 FL=1